MATVQYVRPTGMRTAHGAAAVALLILASALMTACASSPGRDVLIPSSSPTVEDAPSGRVLFATNCAVCHGVEGEGHPDWRVQNADGTLPPPPLNGDGHTWHHSDGLLYRMVSQGGKIFEDPNNMTFKSGMPAFGDRLSHEERIAVFTYIKSLWGDKTVGGNPIRESQELVSKDDPFPSDG